MLEDVRVIDLSTDVACAFGAKLFATYGADVLKIELPDGDPIRRVPPVVGEGPDGGVLFGYLNTGKRSVVLNLDDRGGREALRRLIAGADVVFESFAPGALAQRGIDLRTLLEERPQLVVCSVTPFGQTGPRAGWRATSLTAFASGGQMMVCGDPELPPLKVAGHQAYYQAGLHAFASTLTALYAARSTGMGDYIDISVQEVQAFSLEGSGPAAMVHGTDAGRSGNQGRATWSIYPCADGYVGVASMARQVQGIYDCIGHPNFAEESAGLDQAESNQLLQALITEWTLSHTAQEIFELSGPYRAPFSLIPGPRKLLEWPPLQEVGFWQEVDHPVLGRHALPSGAILIQGSRGAQRRAPLLGEHTKEVLEELSQLSSTAPKPPSSGGAPRPLLEGLRVLDLTQVWAGPFGAHLLADMGPDVIHIEGPAVPDAVRGAGGLGGGGDPRAFNKSAYFNEYNRNKRGLALDLQQPEGLEAFRRLVAKADVVMENWSSGVAERLGIGYEALRAINPRIIVLSMPGFGHQGGDAQRIGFGPTIEQMGGLVALQGYEGGPPHKSGLSYGDPVAGITAAAGAALALVQRLRTGEGSYVVVPQRDSVIGLVGEYIVAESIGQPLPVRIGNRHPAHAPHNVYRTKDDAGRPRGMGRPGLQLGEINETWLALEVDSDEAWRGLRSVIADPRLNRPEYETAEGRRASVEEIDAVVAEWASPREPNETAALLQAAGVAASPVLSPLMLVRDEHLAARRFYPEYDHPEAGRHLTAAPVWRLARRPLGEIRPAPCFGEHNYEILTELVGYTEAEVAEMERKGVIADSPRGA